jgi:putative GTP pyrophosphokinase
MDYSISKSQIDKLGERLRASRESEDDLRMLDAYRRSFNEQYEHVIRLVRERLNLSSTGRPAKSTTSIREKLQRESVRLSQIQDIAGCRIIVDDVAAQDKVTARIMAEFPRVTMVDRRLNPSHGYRAVHLIVHCDDKLIEIQCRTQMQHLWSQLSERLADVVDPALKYGSGPESALVLLAKTSELVAQSESFGTDAWSVRNEKAVNLLKDNLKGTLVGSIELLARLSGK